MFINIQIRLSQFYCMLRQVMGKKSITKKMEEKQNSAILTMSKEAVF